MTLVTHTAAGTDGRPGRTMVATHPAPHVTQLPGAGLQPFASSPDGVHITASSHTTAQTGTSAPDPSAAAAAVPRRRPSPLGSCGDSSAEPDGGGGGGGEAAVPKPADSPRAYTQATTSAESASDDQNDQQDQQGKGWSSSDDEREPMTLPAAKPVLPAASQSQVELRQKQSDAELLCGVSLLLAASASAVTADGDADGDDSAAGDSDGTGSGSGRSASMPAGSGYKPRANPPEPPPLQPLVSGERQRQVPHRYRSKSDSAALQVRDTQPACPPFPTPCASFVPRPLAFPTSRRPPRAAAAAAIAAWVPQRQRLLTPLLLPASPLPACLPDFGRSRRPT